MCVCVCVFTLEQRGENTSKSFQLSPGIAYGDHVSKGQVQSDTSYYRCLIMTGDLNNNLVYASKWKCKGAMKMAAFPYPSSDTKESTAQSGGRRAK